MEETKTVGFHEGFVILSADDYMAVHQEIFALRQRNLELQTALESIKVLSERVVR